MFECVTNINNQKGFKGLLKRKIFGSFLSAFKIAEDQMSAMQTQMNNVQNELDNMKSEVNSAQDKMDRINDKFIDTVNELQILSVQLQEQKVNVQSLTDQMQQLDTLHLNYDNLREELKTTHIFAETTHNAVEANFAQLLAQDARINQDIAQLAVNLRNNNAMLEQHKNTLAQHSEQGNRILSKLKRIESPSEASPVVYVESENKVVSSSSSTYDSIDYFDFENHFRGSIEHIKNVQSIYLPYFQSCSNVLDLGCGRGEFLSLLKENNIPAKGVDLYEEYAQFCCDNGLEVSCGDAIAYLAQCETVDGIFLGQVIEHLELSQIIRICKLAYEKLPEGGCIIMETPNPTSLAIYTHAFYIDPSHTKPVHPLTMRYLLEKAGFTQIEVIYPEASRLAERIPHLENCSDFNESMDKLTDLLYGSQDYAVIAKK